MRIGPTHVGHKETNQPCSTQSSNGTMASNILTILRAGDFRLDSMSRPIWNAEREPTATRLVEYSAKLIDHVSIRARGAIAAGRAPHR